MTGRFVYLCVNCRKTLACLAVALPLLPSPAAAMPADASPSSPVPIVLLRRSEKKPPNGGGADVLVPADPSRDDIARRAAAMLADPAGFGQQALRLDRFVRTYLLHDPSLPPARRTVLEQPAFLFLSDREGGYPADSFWLEQPGGGLKEMRDVTFVDTVVREKDLVPGRIDGLQEIYAHELGHLMMAALTAPAPRRASSAMHFVTARTDAGIAFIEGFGEHFQPMSQDAQRAAAVKPTGAAGIPEAERTWYGRFEREQVDGCVICPANVRFLRWHGAREQRLRDVALRSNQFVFQPSLPAPLTDGSRPTFEARLYRDLAMPAAGAPLKNGVQMMESEGVVATLFYRLATDGRLRSTYREAAFYEPFLDEAQLAVLRASGPRAVVTPAQNVYLKLFEVMHRSFAWGEWPTIEFVAGYTRRFPDEAPAVYDVFLDVTRGVTVDREAAARHAEPGYLADLRERLLTGRATLGANLGPALWLNSPSMTFAMGVYRYFVVPSPFTFDLNAADVPDLLTVPGVSAELAAAIVKTRESRGSFSSVKDLAGVPGFTPELLSAFQSMSDKMQARLKKPEAPRRDSPFFKNIMVPLLRGSYYVAAAWQLGVALLFAGTAFAAVRWTARLMFRHDDAEAGAGTGSGRGWRHWWRRGRRGVARGMGAAIIPCLVSVLLYWADILPTPVNMGLVGIALGAALALLRVALRRPGAATLRVLVPGPTAVVVASIVIGWMY